MFSGMIVIDMKANGSQRSAVNGRSIAVSVDGELTCKNMKEVMMMTAGIKKFELLMFSAGIGPMTSETESARQLGRAQYSFQQTDETDGMRARAAAVAAVLMALGGSAQSPTSQPTLSSCVASCAGSAESPVCGSNGQTYNNSCLVSTQ